MKKSTLGKWLFVFYFSVSCSLGFMLIVFGKTLLHIDDPMGVFSILIPTIIGQVAVISKWFVDRANSEDKELDIEVDIPAFIVKAPPIAVALILIVSIVLKIIGFNLDAEWTPSDDQFKAIVTFAMSVLNATSIYLVSVFFSKTKKNA